LNKENTCSFCTDVPLYHNTLDPPIRQQGEKVVYTVVPLHRFTIVSLIGLFIKINLFEISQFQSLFPVYFMSLFFTVGFTYPA